MDMDEQQYQAEVKALHDKMSQMLDGKSVNVALHAIGVLLWDLASDEECFEEPLSVNDRIESVIGSAKSIMQTCAQIDEEDKKLQ